jgi:hypothetical protein
MPDPHPRRLSAEDAKLVTLARSARARTRAAEGAAVRDLDGRTYAGASVGLPSLNVSAAGVAVAMAASSAAAGLEAAVVLGDASSVGDGDLAIVRDFAGAGVPVLYATPAGDVCDTATT